MLLTWPAVAAPPQQIQVVVACSQTTAICHSYMPLAVQEVVEKLVHTALQLYGMRVMCQSRRSVRPNGCCSHKALQLLSPTTCCGCLPAAAQCSSMVTPASSRCLSRQAASWVHSTLGLGQYISLAAAWLCLVPCVWNQTLCRCSSRLLMKL